MRRLVEAKGRWEGSPAQLLRSLELVAADEGINTKARSWPKAAQSLSRRLNEAKSNLADAGIAMSKDRTAEGRVVVLEKGDNTVNTVNTVIKHRKRGSEP